MPLSLGQAAKAAGVSNRISLKLIKRVASPHSDKRMGPSTSTRRSWIVYHENRLRPFSKNDRTLPREICLALHELVRTLREQVEDLRTDRDSWREQAQRLLLTAGEPKKNGLVETGVHS